MCVAIGFLYLMASFGMLPQEIYLSPRIILPVLVVYLGLVILPIRSRSAYIIGSIFVILLVLTTALLMMRVPSRVNNVTHQDDWDIWQQQMRTGHMFRFYDNETNGQFWGY
jgi:hypothetical protein